MTKRLSKQTLHSNGRFRSGDLHPRRVDHDARLRFLRQMNIGTLTITSEKIRVGDRSRQYVSAVCARCGETRDYLVENMIRGSTRSCRCERGIKYRDPRAKTLGERFDAIKQRCQNFRNPSYADYGGRGIECRFTREGFITYALRRLEAESYCGLDIDRIDNDGHYEEGNLRLVPRSINLRNKCNNKIIVYNGATIVAADLYDLLKRDYPNFKLAKGTTARLAAAGISMQEILSRRPRIRRKP